MLRRILALLALTLTFGAVSAMPASAHAVACNAGNAYYQDMRKLKQLILKPSVPGVHCSTFGSRVLIFKLRGPCTTWFQTVGVDKETNLPVINVHWSATYRVSRMLTDGFNRCKPRR